MPSASNATPKSALRQDSRLGVATAEGAAVVEEVTAAAGSIQVAPLSATVDESRATEGPRRSKRRKG